MIEVVHTVYSVLSYGNVVKHQAVHEAVLHPPDDLLLAQHAGGGHGNVLEGQTVDISGSSLFPLIRPGLKSCSKSVELKCNIIPVSQSSLTLQEDLEVLQCRPGVLHPDVPEGDGVSPTAFPLPSHVEERPARPVVPLREVRR